MNSTKIYKVGFYFGVIVSVSLYALNIFGIIKCRNSDLFFVFVGIETLVTILGIIKFVQWHLKHDPLLIDLPSVPTLPHYDESKRAWTVRDVDATRNLNNSRLDTSRHLQYRLEIKPQWMLDYLVLSQLLLVYRHLKKDNVPQEVEAHFAFLADYYYNEMTEEEQESVEEKCQQMLEFYNNIKNDDETSKDESSK